MRVNAKISDEEQELERDRAGQKNRNGILYIFNRLSLHQPVFYVNRRFELEGLREEAGILPNQLYTPSLSIHVNTSS